jgi:murein DD-endopeptidase MepM/ murein hydrolase activator NlpD
MEESREIRTIHVGQMQPTQQSALPKRSSIAAQTRRIEVIRSRRKEQGASGREERDEEQRKTATLIIKACVCAALCLAAFLVHLSDTQAAKTITDGIRSVLTYNVDIDETLGKLKFVDNFIPGVSEVFTEKSSLIQPVSGTAAQEFSANGRGILYETAAGGAVCAAADGYVSDVGEDEAYGKYLAVKHGSGVETFYYGLSEIEIQEGKIVSRAQMLGKSGGKILFEVRQDNVAVDPEGYMGSVN